MAEDIAASCPRLARRQGISDMPHRAASRVLGKLAILSRLTFAEPQAAVSRTAAGIFPAARR